MRIIELRQHQDCLVTDININGDLTASLPLVAYAVKEMLDKTFAKLGVTGVEIRIQPSQV